MTSLELDLWGDRGTPTVGRERRDPTAATAKIQWTGQGQPMVPTWNADQAIRHGFLSSWVVARCCEIIARDLSARKFRAGADPDRPQDFNVNAPLARLLGPPPGGPAPQITARRFLWWMVVQRLVTGRMAAEIELQGGRPTWLWPLTAAQLKAIPTEGGATFWSGFEYGQPGKAKKLTPEQVFYDWIPSPDDYRQPYSPLQSARLPVSVQVMIGRYSYAFLKNGAVPATVVVTERFATTADKDAFQAQFLDDHEGPDKAGKTIFVEADDEGVGPVGESIHIEQVGMSAKDARLIEQEKETLEQVAMALGVPWSKLSASGRTFSNASQEDYDYWHMIDALGRDVADAVNIQLAPLLGAEVGWFDMSDIPALQEKPEPTSAKVGAPALIFAQIMQLNEARAEYGLPPVEGGDRFMSVEEINALRGTVDAGGGADARGLPAPEDRTVSDPPVPSPAPERRNVDTGEERRIREWRNVDATVSTLEKRWERAFVRLFNRQAKSVLGALEGKRGHKAFAVRAPGDPVDPSAVFNPDYWADETAAVADDLVEQVAVAGLGRVSDRFGLSFDLAAEDIEAFVSARSNQLAGQVTQTTYEAIQTALIEGVEAGEGIPDLAARVRHVFDVASASRAATIARTEVVSAYNGATLLGGALLPADVVGGSEWIATRDGRVRPEHGAADGQVVPIGLPFSVGGEALLYPGDPNGSGGNTVNCRCAVALLTPDEYAAAKEEGRSAGRLIPLARATALLRAAPSLDATEFRRLIREVA